MAVFLEALCYRHVFSIMLHSAVQRKVLFFFKFKTAAVIISFHALCGVL